MHSLHNYNQRNERNQDSRNDRNVGNKSKENRTNESNYGGSNKSASVNKASDHSISADKQPIDDKAQKIPILTEKMFASKCTISGSADASKNEQNESNRSKDEKECSSGKASKNNSTDSEQQSGQEEANTCPANKNTLNQAKVTSNYQTSIQQSNTANQTTSPPNSSKFTTGTQVPNRVFVGGISTDTTESELQSLFSQFGNIKATKIIIDREGVPKGYGFITFTTEEEANKVLKESDNLVLKNRKLNVAIAVKKQSSNPNLGNSANLSRNFADLNQYNMFYMPNGISSIPAYMNEYPITFPEMYHPYASPHLTAAGLPNSPFAPYPLVYRPSSLYFPSTAAAVSAMHPSASTHPQSATGLPLNLQQAQQGQTNAQDTSQYSNQQTSIQSQQQSHSNQQQQANQSQQMHHHSSRLNSNNSNNPNSSHQMASGSGGNQTESGYQSQYHLHHMNNHLNAHHQHLSHHHSHQPSHAQSNMAVASSTTNANQQHAPVFISNTMPYVHPLSLQYNHGLASIAPTGAFTANTTQPHQTSHQSHYSHPLSSQHSQQAVNQFQMNPQNWNSQWR